MQYKAKKSLGQNFLKSEPALRKIIEAGEVKKDDVILEIGPGKGKLTEKLLEKSNFVIAVEKDRELFEFLKIKFAKEIEDKSLTLIQGNILGLKINEAISASRSLAGKKFSQVLGPGDILPQPDRSKTSYPLRYKIIANIPYNITGAILKKFLTEDNQPERMVLMVQHEVAKRIVASSEKQGQNGKESLLSISVKAYGEPKMVMKVPSRYFSPAPKVDSAVIVIKNISRRFFAENSINEEKFWEIVRLGFAHKRKKLSGNLKSLKFGPDFAQNGNLRDKRAEDLALMDWVILTK